MHVGRVRLTAFSGFAAGSRQIAGKRAPTPSADAGGRQVVCEFLILSAGQEDRLLPYFEFVRRPG
jgi:hypothetical protein